MTNWTDMANSININGISILTITFCLVVITLLLAWKWGDGLTEVLKAKKLLDYLYEKGLI